MRYVISFAACILYCSCSASKHEEAKTGISKEALSHLQNTRWELHNLPDTSLPKMQKPLFIIFSKNGLSLNGYAGCNSFHGSYKTDEKGLHIGNLAMTKMMCEYSAIEQKFLHAVGSTDNFIIHGQEMELLSNDKPVASFTAVHLH